MATGTAPAIGAPLERVEARDKVTGAARYAFEQPAEGVAYAWPVQSRVAAGRIAAVDASAALELPGVIAVISHENAPRLADVPDGELRLFQSTEVAYRGQIVAAVVADSIEDARRAAAEVRIEYDARAHDVELRADHPGLYKPEKVNPAFPTDTEKGDFEPAFDGAAVRVDHTYETPAYHNNPMEPHASLAVWDSSGLTIHDSTQGVSRARDTIAAVFDLPPERVRVIGRHVGGAFGVKGTPRPQVVLAAIAAQMAERPVKVALTRQQMFSFVGYRTPTIQRLRLGAGADGRLTAIGHQVIEQTSRVREFAEQTAVVTRMMYAGPNRSTSHRLVALNVGTPSWMRAPGECPGMFALESAMDELAIACGLDPIELRVRNEPDSEPESGRPFSSRGLVECLHEGAERFGWEGRDPTPRARRDGPWLVGTGVASATYPAYRQPSRASARVEESGRFTVRVAGADIGTGARTALTQIAADALGVGPAHVRMEIGDSTLPRGSVAGGSSGTASWGTAVFRACEALRERLGELGDGDSPVGIEAEADTSDELKRQADLARHAFGAHFVEARVNADTGEVRVPRVLGVFAAGRIVNPRTARSQFIGGMTMGISMALHEQGVLDREYGDYLNHDLAQYHVASCADVREIEAAWIDEHDDELNPMGSKGIGEIGIVGSAAAVANAVHHATGVRIRKLPIQPDKLVS
jgi:xanthine dehydrogenase YagR molybdenum-binding subunit